MQFPCRQNSPPRRLIRTTRTLAALLTRAYFRTYHRLTITGIQNLPASGSFVLVANHASHLDAAILQAALPLPKIHSLFPAAAHDYFFTHPLRRLLATIILNVIPFGRRVGFRHSLRLCRELLATNGNALLIFPEGTRSRDGRLGPFRPGIGLLLAGTPYPVIPCYLQGVAAAWPKGSLLPRPRHVELHIGAPLSFASAGTSRQSVTDICRQLRSAVESLQSPPLFRGSLALPSKSIPKSIQGATP